MSDQELNIYQPSSLKAYLPCLQSCPFYKRNRGPLELGGPPSPIWTCLKTLLAPESFGLVLACFSLNHSLTSLPLLYSMSFLLPLQSYPPLNFLCPISICICLPENRTHGSWFPEVPRKEDAKCEILNYLSVMRSPSMGFRGAQRPAAPGKRRFTAGKLGWLLLGADAFVGASCIRCLVNTGQRVNRRAMK